MSPLSARPDVSEWSTRCRPCHRSLWRIITDAGRQILPQEEVRVEGRRFSVARQLGEGGFSFVYLVKEIGGSEEMALKVNPKP